MHHRAYHLIDADYVSRWAANLCYNLLVLEYPNFTTNLCKLYPPIDGQIQSQNMPDFKGHCVHVQPAVSTAVIAIFSIDVIDTHYTPILNSMFLHHSHGHCHFLSNVPIWFESVPANLTLASPSRPFKAFLGKKISEAARTASCVSWTIYGSNISHFFSSLVSYNMPFKVSPAADTRLPAHALFKQFGYLPLICPSSTSLLRVITASPITMTIHAYFIHSQRFLKANTQRDFYSMKTQVVKALQVKRGLLVFVAHIHHDCGTVPVKTFTSSLEHHGWALTTHNVHSSDFGDIIADRASSILRIRRSCSYSARPIQCLTPPPKFLM